MWGLVGLAALADLNAQYEDEKGKREKTHVAHVAFLTCAQDGTLLAKAPELRLRAYALKTISAQMQHA